MVTQPDIAPGPLKDFLDELGRKNMALPFHPIYHFDVGPSPEMVKASYAPFIWRWRMLEPMVMRSAEIMTPGPEGHRRVVALLNPHTPGLATTHTMVASIQLVLPGEEAPSHRHSLTAIRFVIRGTGVTTIDGEPCTMAPGDLILTPSWTWHGHANYSDEPIVWMDVLDAAMIARLGSILYEDYPDGPMEPASKSVDASTARFGGGTMRPSWEQGTSAVSPLLRYAWSDTESALHELAKVAASPYDDVALWFTNPLTGGHVLPTMACGMQMLRPGVRTMAHRHSSSSVSHVFRGSGSTIVDGTDIQWEEGDIVVIPPWAWHEHVNHSAEPAYIYTSSDLAILESTDFYREQEHAENGGHQKITQAYKDV